MAFFIMTWLEHWPRRDFQYSRWAVSQGRSSSFTPNAAGSGKPSCCSLFYSDTSRSASGLSTRIRR